MAITSTIHDGTVGPLVFDLSLSVSIDQLDLTDTLDLPAIIGAVQTEQGAVVSAITDAACKPGCHGDLTATFRVGYAGGAEVSVTDSEA